MGGGFKYLIIFTPTLGKWSNLTWAYFSNGLVQPATRAGGGSELWTERAGSIWKKSRTTKKTWRIIPFSKWLITMVSKSPNWGYSPSKWRKWLINRVTNHFPTKMIRNPANQLRLGEYLPLLTDLTGFHTCQVVSRISEASTASSSGFCSQILMYT